MLVPLLRVSRTELQKLMVESERVVTSILPLLLISDLCVYLYINLS